MENGKFETIADESLEKNDSSNTVWMTVENAYKLIYEKNPKKHDMGALIQSLKRYGYQEHVKADKNIGIAAGNGRIEALYEMERDGKYELPRGLARHKETGKWVMPIITGVDAINEAEAQAYLLDSNSIGLLGGDMSMYDIAKIYDEEAYADILRNLQNVDMPPVSMEYDDIAAFLNSMENGVNGVDQVESEDDFSDTSISGKVFSKDQIISAAFSYYRQTGFPYRNLPIYYCMQQINALSMLSNDKLINSNLGYHVSDTYHKHRFHAHANGMKSPIEAFNSDKLLLRALTLESENCNIPNGYPCSLSIVRLPDSPHHQFRCLTSLGALLHVPGKCTVPEHISNPTGEITAFLVEQKDLIGNKFEEPGEFRQTVGRIPGIPFRGIKMESPIGRKAPESPCGEAGSLLWKTGLLIEGNTPQVSGKIVIGLPAGVTCRRPAAGP